LNESRSADLIYDLAEPFDMQQIDQSYLNSETRIRRIRHLDEEQFMFTFKRKCWNNLVEIETEISASDYRQLRPTATHHVHKTRIKLEHQGLHWDVDFFQQDLGDPVYLLMAEVEMPEGTPWYPEVHPLLLPYMVGWVTPGDERFFNSGLHDPLIVTQHLQDFRREKIDPTKLR
jgi:CYTH domain-containing protein